MSQVLTNAEDKEAQEVEGFQWDMRGRIVIMDNGCNLVGRKLFTTYMGWNSFAVIAFDPGNVYVEDESLKGLDEFQLFPQATLGSGQAGTLYHCLDANYSTTLLPMENAWQKQKSTRQVIAKTPVSSVALDHIEGLPNIEWLLLDDRHDNVAILEHGNRALANTLLVQVRIPFRPTHHGQGDIAQISHWMARHGFRFYCFQNSAFHSHLPTERTLEKVQATELLSADALFVPTDERLAAMDVNQLTKLAFILHSVYKFYDLCYEIFTYIDAKKSESYLVAQGYVWPVDESHEFKMTCDYSPDIWG
ncbi:hypothetical protein ELY33_12270 [Vreelandella andesensis]|uniref:FkbM family methyltransferase n=1 Tax=Vreelandella andesensis TaxID=447567 RepID=A0A3S0YGR5_9GAMM|nr:hypothetical protein [Halomonas andesensis]RUR29713.1 hypothetical protein ELY33_12270 [Halomonas andesensis]